MGSSGKAALLAAACLLLAGSPATAQTAGGGTLSAIELRAEGRLLLITLKAGTPFTRYTLSRKGPPEKRDLLVRLPGFATELPAAVDPGDYLLPISVTRVQDAAAPGLDVVFGGVGDSLVSVAQEAGELRILIIPPETRSGAADSYRIGANDVLQIDVFGHEDLNKTLKVSPRGSINFPLIGTVRAEGRSVDDLATEITDRLAKDYIQDPHVTVSVWEYLSQWVNVVGEVAHPGRYYMTGTTTLIDALSQAGGLKEGATGEILVSRRPEEVDPASAGEVYRVDVKALLAGRDPTLNMKLRPGDIVNVPGPGAGGGAGQGPEGPPRAGKPS